MPPNAICCDKTAAGLFIIKAFTWDNTIGSNGTHGYGREHCLQRKMKTLIYYDIRAAPVHHFHNWLFKVTAVAARFEAVELSLFLYVSAAEVVRLYVFYLKIKQLLHTHSNSRYKHMLHFQILV